MPSVLIKDWKWQRDEWIECHPKPWNDAIEKETYRRFSVTMEDWMDQGMKLGGVDPESLDYSRMQFEGFRFERSSGMAARPEVAATVGLTRGRRRG